jgi:amidophosphoribosyltransferase
MGVDMATYSQLIAHKREVADIARHIGADSLAYLSLDGMQSAVRAVTSSTEGHCTACFSGNYPVNIPEWLFEEDREKLIFEEMWGE